MTFADRVQCLTEFATYNPTGITLLEQVAPKQFGGAGSFL